jgi:hypothetical protein
LPDVWVLIVPVREARVMRSVVACGSIGAIVTFTVYYFMDGAVEHVVRCFAASHGFVFHLKFSGHFVVFAIFCKMACILAANGAIGYPLGSSPSSAFASAAGTSSSSPAAQRLIEIFLLLVWRRPLVTLFHRIMLWLLLQIVDCVAWSHVLLAQGWWCSRCFACLPP